MCGIGIYLPMRAISGRYTMPAVWGADICFAILLSALAESTSNAWKRAAYVGLACGIVAVAVANLGKQQKFAARAGVLWQTLEYVEQEARPGAWIAWMESAALNQEEGIHFYLHLQSRRKANLKVCLLDNQGLPFRRRELPEPGATPDYLVTGDACIRDSQAWQLERVFTTDYWAHTHHFQCYLWRR
jgi:hypothetical protein